jgi:hypothetical protein
MATVELNTAARSPERLNINRSDGRPSENTKRSPDGRDKVQSSQDGMKTGARIRGK